MLVLGGAGSPLWRKPVLLRMPFQIEREEKSSAVAIAEQGQLRSEQCRPPLYRGIGRILVEFPDARG